VVYTPLFYGFASVGRGGGGRDFSSKMPRTMSNLPDFPRRPFLYAHLCFYTKSMHPLLSNIELGVPLKGGSHNIFCTRIFQQSAHLGPICFKSPLTP